MQNSRETFKIPVILENRIVFFKWKISENIFLLLTDLPLPLNIFDDVDSSGDGGCGKDDYMVKVEKVMMIIMVMAMVMMIVEEEENVMNCWEQFCVVLSENMQSPFNSLPAEYIRHLH